MTRAMGAQPRLISEIAGRLHECVESPMEASIRRRAHDPVGFLGCVTFPCSKEELGGQALGPRDRRGH